MGLCRWIDENAAVQVRAEWLESEVERRRDPEVPTGAAQAPEELRLVGLGGAHEAAVGGDDLDGGQVVDRQPERALEPTNATAEGQSSDPRVAHHPDRADQTVGLRRDV